MESNQSFTYECADRECDFKGDKSKLKFTVSAHDKSKQVESCPKCDCKFLVKTIK